MRSLVMGFGHRDRCDDGVAYHVVAALRQRLGQEPLADDEDDPMPGEGPLESIVVPQLAPEWLGLARGYDKLFFVDAHVIADREDLHCTPLAAEFSGGAFTHHMTAGTFLALLDALYGERPEAWLVSVRGRAFDFGRELSPQSALQVSPAVDKILGLTQR